MEPHYTFHVNMHVVLQQEVRRVGNDAVIVYERSSNGNKLPCVLSLCLDIQVSSDLHVGLKLFQKLFCTFSMSV